MTKDDVAKAEHALVEALARVDELAQARDAVVATARAEAEAEVVRAQLALDGANLALEQAAPVEPSEPVEGEEPVKPVAPVEGEDTPKPVDLAALATEAAMALDTATAHVEEVAREAAQAADKAIQDAEKAVEVAKKAVSCTYTDLITEQTERALGLLRYARRLCPSDAATANAVLATFEPEAVTKGTVLYDEEHATLEGHFKAIGGTLPTPLVLRNASAPTPTVLPITEQPRRGRKRPA